MPSMKYPARKEKVDDLGFLRTPDRLPGLCALCVLQLEVWLTTTSICGPYNLGSYATARKAIEHLAHVLMLSLLV